jgi:hypothetical protein
MEEGRFEGNDSLKTRDMSVTGLLEGREGTERDVWDRVVHERHKHANAPHALGTCMSTYVDTQGFDA